MTKIRTLRRQLWWLCLIGLVALLALATPSIAQTVEEGLVIGAGEGIAGLEAHSASPKDMGQALLNFATYGTYNPDSVTTPSVAGTVARALNLIGLVMMAALAVLGGLSFTIHTANKGIPGGQIISSFWMPIRVSVSTILLVPLTLGFSTIQLGVNKIAETGNEHGGWVTAQIVDHIRGFGAYAPPLIQDSRYAMQGLIVAEACMLYINSQLNRPDAVRRVQNRTEDGLIEVSYDFQDPKSGLFGRKAPEPAYCGAIRIKVPGSKEIGGILPIKWDDMEGATQDDIANSFLDAMNTTIGPKAQQIANQLFADQVSLRTLQRGGSSMAEDEYRATVGNLGQTMDGAAINYGALVAAYNGFVQTAVTDAVNKAKDELAGASWADEIKECGWVCLGSIYWQTSKSQEHINTIAAALTPTVVDPRLDEKYITDERFVTLQSRLQELNNRYQPSATLSSNSLSNIVSIQHSGAEDSSSTQKWFAVLTQGMARAFVLDEHADFVNQMQKSGQTMSASLDLAFHAKVWTIATLKTTYITAEALRDSASQLPLIGGLFGAKGSFISGALYFVKSLAEGYGELLDTIFVPIMIAGFILAVVLPAIPLFFWLMGVVSWLMFYIECLLVSPIWMAAHGTAEKEGWGSEHTRQGYMLMIGLYLNPILRVAGFAMILVVIYPLGMLSGLLSNYLIGVLMSGSITSPLLLAGAALVLAFFAYSVALRVFSLPNELFERGLRWINGGQEVTGDENASNRVNMMVANFGSRTQFRTGLVNPRSTPN